MKHQMINTNGAAIQIADCGEAEPAFVFLHYWGGSSRTWQGVMDRLGEYAHCVALDQRGWGGSAVTDGRFDLYAMADDAEAIIRALGLKRYVLAGHSMGGKVAQIVAARQQEGLAALVLIAPAPPTPMPVPGMQRAGMLASYASREGVLQALTVLGGDRLSVPLQEQVIEDTLRGAPEAKRAWTGRGMIADVSAGLGKVRVPVTIAIGDRDQIEHEPALREAFAPYLPQATFRILKGIGHLSPLEAPDALADICRAQLQSL